MEVFKAEMIPVPAGGLANPDFDTTSNDTYTPLSRRLGFAMLAVLIWFVSTLLIIVIPTLFLLPYLTSQGITLSDGAAIAEFAKNDGTAIVVQLAAIIPAHLLTIAIAWIAVTQGRKFNFFQSLAMRSSRIKWWHYILIIVGFFLCAAVVQSAMPEQENDMIRILRSSRSAAYLIAIVATLSAPFVEEVIYRGILFSSFKRAFGIPAAFILVTFLFALVHVPQYYPSYSTILLLTILSLTLTGLRVISNSLLPCIVLHTIFNGIQSIGILIEPLINKVSPESATNLIHKLY